MIACMHASAEELLLLLKKWESESKRVVATGLIQPADGFACSFKVSGLVRLDEKAATFSVGELTEDNFALCHISYRGVGYLTGTDADWSLHESHELHGILVDPALVEDVVVLRNPDLSTLVLFALISN